ncbi:MAG: hypothetical protein SOW59_07530 [Corynebacterium sp.]|nr:hypothetical protein [Corynebacterium sp.]
MAGLFLPFVVFIVATTGIATQFVGVLPASIKSLVESTRQQCGAATGIKL